jgi:hypothetical protein
LPACGTGVAAGAEKSIKGSKMRRRKKMSNSQSTFTFINVFTNFIVGYKNTVGFITNLSVLSKVEVFSCETP